MLLIVSTPIYFGQMTGDLKILLDRMYGITHNLFIPLSGKVALIFTHPGPEDIMTHILNLLKSNRSK